MHPVVSVDWLAQQLVDQRLDNGNLVICDCRFALADPELGRSQYHTQHILGAHYLSLDQDLSGPVQRHGGRHPLPQIEVLAATLRSLGVGAHTTVIAYDDSRLAFAARLWWLLRHYLGHEQVAVLDGGWSAWVAAGQPTTAELPARTLFTLSDTADDSGSGEGFGGLSGGLSGGLFEPRPDPSRWVTIEQVKARPATTLLVDSRDPDRYRGEVEPIDPVAGHIPGAVNAFWQEVTDDQGFVLSASLQSDRWQQLDKAIIPKASARSSIEVSAEASAEVSADQAPETSTEVPAGLIVYCGSGVTACVNLLSLELAEITHAQLYAGSWSDWCSYCV